jgi:hypothetical protein
MPWGGLYLPFFSNNEEALKQAEPRLHNAAGVQ